MKEINKNTKTGFPSIDQVQKQYYLKEPKCIVNPNQLIYDQIFVTNADIPDVTAMSYYGTKITFAQFKELVDEAARAYVHLGIGYNDVVMIGSLCIPEAIISLLALDKIGAISKWFDLSAGEGDIEEYALSSKAKAALIMDVLFDKFRLIAEKTNLDKIIVFSIGESMPWYKRIILNLKVKPVKLPKDGRYISYRDFIDAAPKDLEVKKSADPKKVSIYLQSSGTTGKPKTIAHCDYAFGKMSEAIARTDIPLGRGKVCLSIIPPWLAYGCSNTILLPLTLGTTLEIYPFAFEDHVLQNNLGNYTIAFASPVQYRDMIKNKDMLTRKQLEALKKVETFVSGGDKISFEEHEAFDNLYHIPLINGYGSNEGLGVLTLSPNCHNRYGTVGICKPGDVLAAFNPDTNEELPYNQEGEICSLTEARFMEYVGSAEQTQKVLKKHADGKIWLHTGDLGIVDEEGFVTLTGRLARVILRRSFKVSAYVIEDEATACDEVKECVAVSVPDEKEAVVPMAFIILKDEFKNDKEAAEKSILARLNSNLKDIEVPKYIQFVDELPYTSNNKYDFRKLEAIGAEYVASLTER